MPQHAIVGAVRDLHPLITEHRPEGDRQASLTRQEIARIKTGFAVDDFARTQPFKDASVLAGLVGDLREAGLS